MNGAISLVVAYLLGAIPFGYLLVKFKSGQDVRTMGSGNIGATNVLRTTGRKLGILTLLLDIAKGALAVYIAARLTGDDPLWTSLAALTVMFGHAYSFLVGFKGGKAVASYVGAFAFLTPLPLLATTILFVAIVAVTRYISLASIIGAGLMPLGVWLIMHPPWPVTAAAVVAGVFIIYRHQSNIQRIRAGNENQFRWKKSA
jgi:glycerol-3-phosphate acyltransferase PlsY